MGRSKGLPLLVHHGTLSGTNQDIVSEAVDLVVRRVGPTDPGEKEWWAWCDIQRLGRGREEARQLLWEGKGVGLHRPEHRDSRKPG